MLKRNNTITVSLNDVVQFNRGWPCSELRSRSYWFEFDSCGDLVGTNVPHSHDGGAASAMAEGCRRYIETNSKPAWAS